MDYAQIISAAQTVIKDVTILVGTFTALLLAVGGVLSSVNSLLRMIAPLTKWTWDDHLADLIGKWAASKIFKKKDEQ